ncbi:SOS response-associated peptidase [Pedobacter sp.]|uniref:SOS response-associated peptidase n=1 Tax=Pedobacter sp. TaxID=1411316 RepID=UPI003D7FAA3E
MCYHTSSTGTANGLKQKFNLPIVDESLHTIYYHANGYTHPLLPVIANDKQKAIHHFRWGLIPSWVKTLQEGVSLSNQTLNAKSETIFEKPSFRDSILERRCVIPVTGFFEWKQQGKEKVPYYIHPKDKQFFLLGGIFSHWMDKERNELITTFSILTTAANELMADIHNTKKRMPLMIEQRNMDSWIDNSLSKASIMELMNPCDDSNMAAYPVSKLLSAKNGNSDAPEILLPSKDITIQTSLF